MTSSAPLHIAELTCGSGLIGFHLLRLERNSLLLGIDIDAGAGKVVAANAELLGLSRRSRFATADIASRHTENLLVREKPQLLVCNPPYVPVPPEKDLAIEAGAGPDGTAHVMRAIELARICKPRSLALSWCSLADPEDVVREAERCGYQLNSLFITVIGDGEYSGSVEDHLRKLDRAYLNDSRETLDAVAPDGSASFAFLLLAGEFSKKSQGPRREDSRASEQVRTICSRFARRGVGALRSIEAPFAVRVWILDRWDEVRLRAFLHGRGAQEENPLADHQA